MEKVEKIEILTAEDRQDCNEVRIRCSATTSGCGLDSLRVIHYKSDVCVCDHYLNIKYQIINNILDIVFYI